MKLLLMLFICCSVAAVEEIAQTVSFPVGTTVSFSALHPNDGRGNVLFPSSLPSVWKFTNTWNGGLMASRTINRFDENGQLLGAAVFPFAAPTSQFATDYSIWQTAQTKPLFATQLHADIRTAPLNGTSGFTSVSSDPAVQSGPKLSYIPNSASFIGSDSLVIVYANSGNDTVRLTITINITNAAPSISLSASPSIILAGGDVALAPTFSDPEGHTVVITYDYGDGQTGATATHTYAAPGVYTVTATATDAFGATAAAQTTVTVFGDDHLPTARFSTSAPAAAIGEPVVFDAVFSTDPQNSQLTYAWDFGDGSPIGSGVTIAKEFAVAGSFNVTLTVTDGEGFRDSASLAFDITAAEVEQLGVSFSSRVNRSKPGSDTLNVTARFVAGAPIAEGASVAVELTGTRFDATLDKKLRRTQPNAKWTVKKIRNKDVIELRLQAKKRTLGTGFESLGVTQANNRASIPVRVECAGKTLVVKTQSEFKYNRPGTAFNGGGKSDN